MKRITLALLAIILSLSVAFTGFAGELEEIVSEEIVTEAESITEDVIPETDFQIPEAYYVENDETIEEETTEEAAEEVIEEVAEETSEVAEAETVDETIDGSIDETFEEIVEIAVDEIDEEAIFEEETSADVLLEEETSEETSEEETTDDQEATRGCNVVVNPRYANEELEAEAAERLEELIASLDEMEEMPVLDSYYSSSSSAAAYVRSQLKNRNTSFSFSVYYSGYSYKSAVEKFIDKLLTHQAMAHTGVSTEGDYIAWYWDTFGYSWKTNGTTLSVSVTFEYKTTAYQESLVTSRLNSIYNSLGLSKMSYYEKLVTIYKYLCDNITYDYTGLKNKDKYCYTAYKALFYGTCVCQGYSTLFYRMALDNGIEARVVGGDGGGAHSWNTVKFEGNWYFVDATWDAGYPPSYYSYFMRSYSYFSKEHTIRYNTGSTNDGYIAWNIGLNMSFSSKDLQYFKLNKTSASVVCGRTYQITATAYPKCYSDTFKYSSSNTKVATVSSTGKVTAKTYGTATITVTTSRGAYVGKVKISTLFKDVTNSKDTFYKAIYWAANKGIVGGYSDGTFGAAKSCTRKQFVIMLYRFAGKPAVSGYMSFKDCRGYSSTSDTYKAILWASKKGIIKGYNDGTFRPDATVTRKQTMIMLYRYAGKPYVSGTLSFSDCRGYSRSSDTYKAILWGVQKGITNGTNGGRTFSPDANCLRRQIVFFLYKYSKL